MELVYLGHELHAGYVAVFATIGGWSLVVRGRESVPGATRCAVSATGTGDQDYFSEPAVKPRTKAR